MAYPVSLRVGPVEDIAASGVASMPARSVLLTWQNMGNGACSLQGSNDGSNYATIDSATTQYEVRSLSTAAAFIKASGQAIKVACRA